jgi:hypothetical protein
MMMIADLARHERVVSKHLWNLAIWPVHVAWIAFRDKTRLCMISSLSAEALKVKWGDDHSPQSFLLGALRRGESESAVRAIKQAWARHLVLLFRGQTLSQDDQLRFASYFGTLGNRKRAPEALRDRAHHEGRPVSGRGRVAQPPAGRSGLGPRRREDHRVTLCRPACAGRAYTGDGGAVASRRRTGRLRRTPVVKTMAARTSKYSPTAPVAGAAAAQ